MGEQPENGHTLRYRVGQLEERLKAHEEGIRYNAEGAIRRDDRIDDLRGDVDEMKSEVAKVPLLDDRVTRVISELQGAKQALWAAAGGFLILAGTIVWQAWQG